jgi:hypothetical protein
LTIPLTKYSSQATALGNPSSFSKGKSLAMEGTRVFFACPHFSIRESCNGANRASFLFNPEVQSKHLPDTTDGVSVGIGMKGAGSNIWMRGPIGFCKRVGII